jgi:hypothetical protein
VKSNQREWAVHVDKVGIIGDVVEANENLARCAALSRYGEEGRRILMGSLPLPLIYENDTFSVLPR